MFETHTHKNHIVNYSPLEGYTAQKIVLNIRMYLMNFSFLAQILP